MKIKKVKNKNIEKMDDLEFTPPTQSPKKIKAGV